MSYWHGHVFHLLNAHKAYKLYKL